MHLTEFDYDLFVIGGGSGGVRASRIAASLGAKTALAEELYLGGTCVNVGCIPKKLFSYAAHYSQDFHDARSYGWVFESEPKFCWSILRNNKDKEISRLNRVYSSLLENAGVKVYRERATLLDIHTVQVGQQQFTAKEIIIATGGWPFVPDIPGREHAITSNEFFSFETLPDSALVVGGGYIGVEFAAILSGIGVKTSLLVRGSSLLRGFDTEVADILTQEIETYTTLIRGNEVQRIEKKSDGKLLAHMKTGEPLAFDCILFATGRKPNSHHMGLESVGVKMNTSAAIEVDKDYTTSVPNIHAVGDVIDRMALTPVALAEGQVLARRLFGKPSSSVRYDIIPTAVFSRPNLATVGMDEATARAHVKNVQVFRSKFRALRQTLSGGESWTFLKVIVDADTDKVLGAHMLGEDAGEIIQGLAIAITAGATKTDFDNTIGIHPTVAEEFVTMRSPSP